LNLPLLLERRVATVGMDDLELFDVFSTDNNPEPVQKTASTAPKPKVKKSKKPKKERPTTNDTANGKRHHDEPSENGTETDATNGEIGPIAKRKRRNIENPIIVDSFETESDQIVPAAQGLGAPVADHNIIIKKKVNFSEVVYYSIAMQLYSPLQTGNIHRWNLISLRIRLREYIPSSWIRFRRCRLLLLNGMRAFLLVHILLLERLLLRSTLLHRV
jgi:hypothetical protein